MKFMAVIFSIFMATSVFANCEAIKQACLKAGYKEGGAPKKIGVFANCIDPIIFGNKNLAGAVPLPTLDVKLVEACKAEKQKAPAKK